MTKVSPPIAPTIPARWHGGRQVPRKRVVIHGTVSPCEPGGARKVARYFQTVERPSSAHYVVDPIEVVQCVGDHTVAYHAPPNTDTIGVEQCDWVGGVASRWDDDNHVAMLNRTAALVARLCLAYGIPIRWLGPIRLRLGLRGITSHRNVSLAWRQTTHTDPGEGFPRRRFMRLVRAEAARLSPSKKKVRK